MIDKLLKINDVYTLKVPDKKEGIIGSINFKTKIPLMTDQLGIFLYFIGNF